VLGIKNNSAPGVSSANRRAVPTGVLPRCLPQLHEHGVDLPAAVYQVAQVAQRGAAG